MLALTHLSQRLPVFYIYVAPKKGKPDHRAASQFPVWRDAKKRLVLALSIRKNQCSAGPHFFFYGDAFLDRRSFLKSSLVLPSAALLSPDIVANQRTLPSLDRCFMDWEQHMDEVGEHQALTDLRRDMFPITTKRVVATTSERGVVAALTDIRSHYSAFDAAHFEDHSIKAHCGLVLLPSQRRRIRDWWLVLRTTALGSDVRAVRIVFITSCDGDVPASINQWLAARITYRLNHCWTCISRQASDQTALTQEVNRQVIDAMRGMSQLRG